MPPKRRVKHGKKKRAPQRRLPPERLLAQARQSLADGNPRKALELLRRVSHQGGGPGDLPLWLFCACVERARQLAHQGLAKEAAAMRDRARRQRAAIAVQNLPEPDLIRYLRCLDGGEAVSVYAEYLGGRPALAAAERVVADRLVIDRCWAPLERLAAGHALRRDAGPVQCSLDAMDRGDWERAARLLGGIPRRSPFAPWRTFCKAMMSFASGDDRGLERAAGLLPEEFALSGTVAELKRCAGGGERAGPAAVQQALGTDDTLVAATAAKLRQALRRGVEHQIERHLVSLADAVYPENPQPARIDLLMITARATLESPLSVAAFFRVAARTVPEEHFHRVLAQATLLLQQFDPDENWDTGAAVIYLDNLAVPFPRPGDQELARACVLESLARSGAAAGIHLRPLDASATKNVTTLLGAPPQHPDLVLVDLLLASLAADPQSTTGYHFLLDLLRRHPTADAARLRAILHELAARYPEAPDPWLELATLHYSRNAYRRAEEALGEALRRAPYDERILDLQAIGFLKSADQSRKRGRFSLAAQDLARAVDLRRPRLEPILRVKRLLLDLVEAGAGVEAAAAPHLEALTPAARLRTLAVTIHDLEENRHVRNVAPRMASALRQVLARAAGSIARLDPDEALDLVADLPADCRILYGSLRVAPVLSDWWRAVLARLDGDRLTACFDTLLACGGRKTVRSELERRLRAGRATDHDPLLPFYLAVIRYEEREDYDAERFLDILERADAAGRRRLREAAKRLAPVVDQPLRHALQQFDFESLERMVPSFEDLREMIEGMRGLGVLDEVPGDLGDPEAAEVAGRAESAEEPESERFERSVRELKAALSKAARNGRLDRSEQGLLFEEEATLIILDRIEVMIGNAGLRGAAPDFMRETAQAVRAGAEIGRILDDLATWCTANARRAGLSQELDALLYTERDAGAAGKERR